MPIPDVLVPAFDHLAKARQIIEEFSTSPIREDGINDVSESLRRRLAAIDATKAAMTHVYQLDPAWQRHGISTFDQILADQISKY